MAEAFFATLKNEFYYRRVWPTKARAKRDVGAWIEGRPTNQAFGVVTHERLSLASWLWWLRLAGLRRVC